MQTRSKPRQTLAHFYNHKSLDRPIVAGSWKALIIACALAAQEEMYAKEEHEERLRAAEEGGEVADAE